jgi:CheY-like chemotaxis protein
LTLKGKILVAEDAKANQALICALLKRLGLGVTLAEDGQEALNLLAKETFDLVLMDMQMPVMNGYDATRTIRRMGINIPVVALTAHAMKGDDRKCYDAGCDDYLTKPIDREKLKSLLLKISPFGPVGGCFPDAGPEFLISSCIFHVMQGSFLTWGDYCDTVR